MENKNEYEKERINDIESGKIDSEREANIAVLSELYRNAELAKTSIESLIPKCEDETFKEGILRAYTEFDTFSSKASRRLIALGETPKGNNAMKNTMMKTSIAMSTAIDNSTQKLADMLVQGNNMGIIDINKLLNGYRGVISQETNDLATELLEIEQRCLNSLKRYL